MSAGASFRAMASTAWGEVGILLAEMESGQRLRVLELARRLRPGLTLEDIANPHDFPELGDPDWQHEDGVLSGILAVQAAVRARARDVGE